MDDRTRRALGLLVVAALAGFVWLVLTLAGADPDASTAARMTLGMSFAAMAVCGVIGLGALAAGLLRREGD